MQWLLMAIWAGIVIWGTRMPRRHALLRPLMAIGFLSAMFAQLYLLFVDGKLSLETALPLHLCGLFGVLSIPMLWRAPKPLYEAAMFLAAPAAFLTLFFPAVMHCSHPRAMRWAFLQLHVLLALMPLYHLCTGKPPPIDPRRTLILGSGYLVCISAFNRAFGTNYLFLRAAPSGTPLDALFAQGTGFYLCSLAMLCMLVFAWLAPWYAHLRK